MYVYRQGEPAVAQVVPVAETRPDRGQSEFNAEFCGTEKGYQRHYRHGNKPCADCKQAHSKYSWAKYKEGGK